MGAVIGRENAPVLPYDVKKATNAYELRIYKEHPVVEGPWQENSRNTFMSLARYIGAFSNPENSQSMCSRFNPINALPPITFWCGASQTSINFHVPITRPDEKISMTAPVEVVPNAGRFSEMRFFAPDSKETVKSMPVPLCPALKVQNLEGRRIAARQFNGTLDLDKGVSDALLKLHLSKLLEALSEDRLVQLHQSSVGATTDLPTEVDGHVLLQQMLHGKLLNPETGMPVKWSVAVYNSPFCLPHFKRNEIWVEL